MICLDNTDTLHAGASVDAVVDYTVHGLVGTTFTQMAAGQLSDTDPSLLYTAPSAVSIVSVIFVNTHSSAVTVNLYLDPTNAGNPRRMIPKDVSLGIGYSLHFDGQRISIMDTTGQIICGFPSPLPPTKGGTGLATYTKGDLLYASAADVLGALGIGTANYKLFTNAAGDLPEWAAGIKIGTTTRDMSTPSGYQEISGLTFKPSCIVFLATRADSSEMSLGWTNGTNNYCIFDAHLSSADTYQAETTYSFLLMQTASIYYAGAVSLLGVDGFTISWSKYGAKTGLLVIHWLAFR